MLFESFLSQNFLFKKILFKSFLSQKILSKKILSEKIFSKKILSKKILSKKILSKKILSKKNLSKKILSKKILSEIDQIVTRRRIATSGVRARRTGPTPSGPRSSSTAPPIKSNPKTSKFRWTEQHSRKMGVSKNTFVMHSFAYEKITRGQQQKN
jgi:hypothetical protein